MREKGFRSLIVSLINNPGSIGFEQCSTRMLEGALGSAQLGDFADATGVLDEGSSRIEGNGLVAIECSGGSYNVERITDVVLLQGSESLCIFEV